MRTAVARGFESWRELARELLREGVPPDGVAWLDGRTGQGGLPFGLETLADASGRPELPETTAARRPAPRIPRRFVELAEAAACHRSGVQWPVLYRLLWRLTQGERHLLDLASDADVHAAAGMASQVQRDEHKMRAFVRFTPVADAEGERYVAWYAPDHLIVRRAAPFFSDRFSSMRWSILTPDDSAHWDGQALTFSEGVEAPAETGEGAIEDLWKTYYQAIFNPARVNLPATLREMPLRRWSRLPEAALIPSLVGSAHERTLRLARTAERRSARPFLPAERTIASLRGAAAACRGCDLHARATQVVFGEGPPDARLLLVGEQPGDAEDIGGRPFVGPAGQVLARALAAAGIDRSRVYVTNAVKHFSFVERGKRRIHQTPRASEVHACRPWLEAEIHAVHPACVVLLGSTAARALLGPQARVMQLRGSVIGDTAWAPAVLVTVHPSAVLRADDGGQQYFEMLVGDLRQAREAAGAHAA